MSKIFEENSDSDNEIKVDNEYAKNYDTWRRKEELNKLKTKYGEDSLHLLEEDTSSSSDDDEEGIEWTEEVEKDFFKTLSCLKNKDPRIYDENVKFFDDKKEDSSKSAQKVHKKNKEKTNLKDAEESSDKEMDTSRLKYEEQQEEIFKGFQHKFTEDDEWGGVTEAKHEIKEEKGNAEEQESGKDKLEEWLVGQEADIDDKEAVTELKPLKEFWTDPHLDEKEKFLRDYILKKKFLNRSDDIPAYNEVVHDSDKDLSEDEEAIEAQEEFEHKYNFRFEEPDQEFIKRYPRTVESSLRKTNDKRKLKRVETKERKQKEKEQKMQELRKLQELKRKEIEEKIEKLKEITGNDNIAFNNEDFEADFDPEAHDRRMQALFNDEFYEGPEGEQKPEFPELDEYLEIENWGKWNGNEDDGEQKEGEDAPHCEDEDFNMDCDYDPQAAVKKELIENSKGKKKRKRKSLFAKAVSQPKPVFDPNDKTYEEYLDEYYKLDCEDIIGDIPCRFKYKKVIPNSFGLTVEEILTASDRELNKWCSLKKAIQCRPEHVEKYDQIAFEKKAQNIELKRKILPSLFASENINKEKGDLTGENEKINKNGATKNNAVQENSKKRKVQNLCNSKDNNEVNNTKISNAGSIKETLNESTPQSSTENNVQQTNSKDKKKRKKKKKNRNQDNESTAVDETSKQTTKKSKKRKHSESGLENEVNTELQNRKFKKAKNVQRDRSVDVGISDARLSAYGIKPKKFKNKLKYGSK